jgi:hypothetical protein
MLKDVGIIVFLLSNWADAVDEVVDSVECQISNSQQRRSSSKRQFFLSECCRMER